jgi:hypothetical protein
MVGLDYSAALKGIYQRILCWVHHIVARQQCPCCW